MDRDAIAAVLASNDGNLERTAEQLLSAGTDTTAGAAAAAVPPPDVTHDEEMAQELYRQMNAAPEPPARPPPQQQQQQIPRQALRGTPVNLPDNFLRVPGSMTEESAQVQADERLAAMLQNADFLAAHPEYASYGGRAPAARTSHAQHAEDTGPSVTEQLQTMGADMKRNLLGLAAKWNLKPSTAPAADSGSASVPLMNRNSTAADEDEAEVVTFDQGDTTTRRGSGGHLGSLGGSFGRTNEGAGDAAMEMQRAGSGAKKDL
ncbi:hypothetical protein JKP88DRAFT_351773 [Tribonema minus]|uniref:CUE domain-containing protein n=1 Tax=Tribonema minus TaxID=303371 RepID=A0A836CN65_9STRA|nr:hypothetical protein JKP88DRAFT_351773 [Tribonema minus]